MSVIKEMINTHSGLYTINETAFYSQMPIQTLHRWLKGSSQGEKVFSDEFKDKKFISFLDFIQILAIRHIRNEHNIPLENIRNAIEHAKEKYGIDYPFARKHLTYAYGKSIIIKMENEPYPIEISDKVGKQAVMNAIVENYLKDLHFNEEGLADKYTIYQQDNIKITIDPKYYFGQPFIEGKNLPIYNIWEAINIEDDNQSVANMYQVSLQEVDAITHYFNSLQRKTA